MIPYFAYRDAPAAIAFLERALGFRLAARLDAPDGGVIHAEMAFGEGRVMLGSGSHADATLDPAARTTGHGIYVVVDDVERHHAHAVSAGAEIVYPPEDTGFGTRRYRLRDPEGYEWSFGTYRPA